MWNQCKTVFKLFCFLIFILTLSYSCNHNTIEVLLFDHKANENGYYNLLGYSTQSDLILAYVQRTFTLKIKGKVKKTIEVKYWEWFRLHTLPNDKTQWTPEDWKKVKPFVGKKFFFADEIGAGPKIVADPPVKKFRVEIEEIHELYLNGSMQGTGPPVGQTIGEYGYFEQDDQGTGPSVLEKDENGTVVSNYTDAWKKKKAPAVPKGRINNKGDKALTLTINHEGNWEMNPGANDWSVDWKYEHDFGKGQKKSKTGNTPHAVPKQGP